MDPDMNGDNEIATRIFGSDLKRKIAQNTSNPHRLVGTVRSVNPSNSTYIFVSIDGEEFELASGDVADPPQAQQMYEVVCGVDDGVLGEYVRIPLGDKFDIQTYGRFLEFAGKKPEFFYPN